MTIFAWTKFDPTKITGPYSVLSVFIVLVEALLASWIYRAEGPVERSVAGLLMTVILVLFLLTLRSLKQEEGKSVMLPELGGKITPAEKEATVTEIELPEPEKLASPDRSYTINRPPSNWVVKELTLADFIGENLGITDQQVKEKFWSAASQTQDILVFQSPEMISIIPIPGKTIADGRKMFSALEVLGLTRLSIIPMDRAQPPMFAERPFEHNFYVGLAGFMQLAVLTLREISSGSVPKSGRRYLLAEFRQEIRNATINGKENNSLNTNVTVMGIEGELRDHLLVMNYNSLPDLSAPALDANLKTLRLLVSSFQPLKAANPDEQRQKYTRLADEKYAKFIQENGAKMFVTEFGMAVARLSGMDMDDPEIRLKATKLLGPFEKFAKTINFENETIDSLWTSLHEAESGNASDFKKLINDLTLALLERGPVSDGNGLTKQAVVGQFELP